MLPGPPRSPRSSCKRSPGRPAGYGWRGVQRFRSGYSAGAPAHDLCSGRQRCCAVLSVFVPLEFYSPHKMPKAPARGAAAQLHTRSRSDPAVAAKQVRITNRQPTGRLNRRLNPLTKITGARASSLLPSRDTPAVIQPGPDGLSCHAAEAAWHAVTPSIAGTPHVRISRAGGRTYPASVMPGHFPPSLRGSRARCRCTTRARPPGECWPSTWTRHVAAPDQGVTQHWCPPYTGRRASSLSGAGPARMLTVICPEQPEAH